MYDFLKKVPLFAGLSDTDLYQLCQMAQIVALPAGDVLFSEGDSGDKAYIIKSGQLEILKSSAQREVLLAVRGEGEVIGEMSLLEEVPRMAGARARTNAELLAISSEQLDHLLNSSPSAARAMLNTITARWRATEAMLRQSEKMAQLGTLTAGVAHELNNPAAAAQRGASQLKDAMTQLQQAHLKLNELSVSDDQLAALQVLDDEAKHSASQPNSLDPLERSDRESDLESWLDDHSVANGWELAPTLVNMDYDTTQLENLASNFDGGQLPTVIAWLGATFTVYSLLETVGTGASRISEIVKSLKTYAYLDQAPVQTVDVHDGLNNTLVMLRGKLKNGINVKREYGDDVPTIQAYGSELNQVWTNILDNAADAMQSKGEITLRTCKAGQFVVVELEDNGPGVPQNIQAKIFDPFFTTKPPGQGTGLGLNISYNIVVQKHRGEIKVHSRPGKTVFEVRIPINFEEVDMSKPAVEGVKRPADEKLMEILSDSKNIAVVGISAREDRPAFSVSAYLKEHGYHIFPVNPNLTEVLDLPAYPDLESVPEKIDVVLIFRQPEAVPLIVDEAIRVEARVVWMQEGIVHEQAAELAKDAGLDVVMDTCMRESHKRLVRDK